MLAVAAPSIPEEEPSQLSSPGAPLKRQTSAIPEGENEDGEEEDLDGFPDDEEPVVSVLKLHFCVVGLCFCRVLCCVSLCLLRTIS